MSVPVERRKGRERDYSPPIRAQTNPLDVGDSGGNGGHDAESEKEEIDDRTSTWVNAGGSRGTRVRAPFDTVGTAAPPLQLQISGIELNNGRESDAPPTGERKNDLNVEDGGVAVSGEDDAGSTAKQARAGTPAGAGFPESSDGGGSAPAANRGSGGTADPSLQRQMSSTYALQTKEEVKEFEDMMKAIAPTPRKAKRVYNM